MRAIIRATDDALVVRLEGEADSLAAPLDAPAGIFSNIDEQLAKTGASRLVVDFRDLVYIDGTGLQELTDYLCGISRSKLVCFVGPGPGLSQIDATLVRPLPAQYSQSVDAACSCSTPSFDPKTRDWRAFAEQFETGFDPSEPSVSSESDSAGRGRSEKDSPRDETVIDLDEEAVYLKAQPQSVVDPMSRPLEFRRGEEESD